MNTEKTQTITDASTNAQPPAQQNIQTEDTAATTAEDQRPESASSLQRGVRKNAGSKHLNYVYQAEEQLSKTAAQRSDDVQESATAQSSHASQENPDEKERSSKAPENWTHEDKQAFASLPEEGRKIVLNIQKNLLSGWNKKMQQAAQYRTAFEEVAGGLAPFAGKFKNMAEFTEHLQSVENFENEMKRNPARTLALLAEQAGVDLTELAGYRPNPVEETLLPLQRQLARMEARLNAPHAPEPQLAPHSSDEDAQAIAAFAQETDERGNPLHPHFAKVAPVMGAMMLQDGTLGLKEAYEQAIQLLPEVREENRRTQERKAQAAQELEKAKRAAALKTRSTPGQFVPAGKKRKHPLDYIFEAEQSLAEK